MSKRNRNPFYIARRNLIAQIPCRRDAFAIVEMFERKLIIENFQKIKKEIIEVEERYTLILEPWLGYL